MQKPKETPYLIEEYAKNKGYQLPSQAQIAVRAYIYDNLRIVYTDCKDPYAKSYARCALSQQMTGHTLEVQVKYALVNLQYWRGDTARKVKANLNYILEVINDPGCFGECNSCITPIC